MLPVGPLMVEHRLIERMITVMEKEAQKMKQEGKASPEFIETAVDFIRTYADRCHHGKEEDILFTDLAQKELSKGHKKTMDDLIQEHVLARNTVKKLLEAKAAYVRGNREALRDMIEQMDVLARFYPGHIEKEDKHFFIPCMSYFTKQEQDAMLKKMRSFDRTLIHEKYKKVVEAFEG